ncbi:MAG: hypothetical protein WCF23_07130 [Candidatus Nitrosopolaris sp.]
MLYGTENVLRTVLRLVSETRSRIDACIDHTGPSLVVEIEGVKGFFITEITKTNISYCKELIKLVDELAHRWN